ncbi:MAG: (d)CMP kinase [Candidatus Aureabacteria bacterium]|nr:(d)CMP kinase [Candidatus Auribacterota bacterium]
MQSCIITIDGPAGSGKSTLARQLAEALDFAYLNTGFMYRALTLEVLQKKIDPEDEKECVRLARKMHFKIVKKDEEVFLYLDGKPVSEKIRSERVDRNVSIVSRHPEVRSIMVEKQRELGSKRDTVVEGRDAGTRVFPDARAKIFVTATIEERVKRRHLEYAEQGQPVGLAVIMADLKKRDEMDSRRSCSPLSKAKDAFLLDTTGMTKEEQLKQALDILREKGVLH